jgi:AcrR family transcriptional regulator
MVTPKARRSIGSTRNPAAEEAILDAATAILTEGGYAAFSIEAVARRAKAGKPTIYRWWPSKAHLLLDVYARLKERMPEVDTGTLEGDLAGFLTNLTTFWGTTSSGSVFRSLVAEAQTDPIAAEALAAYSDGRVAHTAELIRRAQARGELRPDADPHAASDLLSAYAWKLALIGRLDDPDHRIPHIAAIMARGLLK